MSGGRFRAEILAALARPIPERDRARAQHYNQLASLRQRGRFAALRTSDPQTRRELVFLLNLIVDRERLVRDRIRGRPRSHAWKPKKT